MKIALIGYGKMGRAIGEIALKRGHELVATIDVSNLEDFDTEGFRSADVAIEFTTPATAYINYQRCFAAHIPVVSGTTGWTGRMKEIREQCEKNGQTFFYASNFSIGVNVFFALNSYLARLMNDFPAYEVSMKEVHHIHKLDAPSGTAITLANAIIENIDGKKDWELVGAGEMRSDASKIPVTAIREGETPGFHEIKYESAVDEIVISHNAKSRAGFALGAVLAAEFAADKKGFLTMNDMLKL
jgi:4-hydroxy-tetrahydrodipicolinate reductase